MQGGVTGGGYKSLNSNSIGIEIVNCGFKQHFINKVLVLGRIS
ncbi:hypothetical protein XBO1_2380050 [Xenorhabdus bovienii str. oregonense]|uniref:Uncharacterized protein n=1 Tax=Xenorhabdus bovienii str. oregonense TaxID=1398202 RepID=A0A077P6C1_XENBV|nr:hypothetical protein XBO1_2380050 [Xenorhabdus bovienii str. oregonense]